MVFNLGTGEASTLEWGQLWEFSVHVTLWVWALTTQLKHWARYNFTMYRHSRKALWTVVLAPLSKQISCNSLFTECGRRSGIWPYLNIKLLTNSYRLTSLPQYWTISNFTHRQTVAPAKYIIHVASHWENIWRWIQHWPQIFLHLFLRKKLPFPFKSLFKTKKEQ
jgi:hypothetical protein